MEKRYLFALAAAIISASLVTAAPLTVPLSSEAAILINADTGAILFEKNAYDQYFPASTTKIATALYALEVQQENLDVPVTIEHEAIASITEEAKKRANYTLPAHWVEVGSTHIGLKKGEVVTFRTLIFGNLIASGNDAANAIAQYIGGTIPNFVEELNGRLKELGCKNTHFCNPNGLHHPKHKTTAYDLSLIAREALKNPTFREVVKTVRYTKPKTNKQEATTLIQGNQLLRKGKNYYSKAIGVKTGYTFLAQRTLVAAATHEDRTLIAVLLRCKERDEIFADARRLFEEAFSQTAVERVLLKSGHQKFSLRLPGAERPVFAYLNHDVCADYFPAEEPKIKCLLYWDKLDLPIAQGQRLGELHLLAADSDTFIKSVPLFAEHDVDFTFWHRLSRSSIWKWAIIIGVAASLAGFLVLRRR